MPFSVNEQYHAAVVDIKGKFLGSVEGDAFKAAMNRLKDEGKTHVVINLGTTDLMDSSGIGLLISALTSMRRADGDVRLANMQKRVKNLFLMTRLLGPVFDDYDSVDAALHSFETDPPEKAPSDAS
jgi:anti-sigma B factor antagonist